MLETIYAGMNAQVSENMVYAPGSFQSSDQVVIIKFIDDEYSCSIIITIDSQKYFA
jgi:hypothetical protein